MSTLIEINKITKPFLQNSKHQTITTSLKTGESYSVKVCDFFSLNQFSLITLTRELVNKIEIHEVKSNDEKYVGGVLKITSVFHKTDVIGKAHSGIFYLKHCSSSKIQNASDELENGNIFISKVEYPELAGNIDEEISRTRFYKDGHEEIMKSFDEFQKDLSVPHSQKLDLFCKNQFSIFKSSLDEIKKLNFFIVSEEYNAKDIRSTENDLDFFVFGNYFEDVAEEMEEVAEEMEEAVEDLVDEMDLSEFDNESNASDFEDDVEQFIKNGGSLDFGQNPF